MGALSTNKAHTRAVMDVAGTPVARGEVLRQGGKPSLPLPFILKPCSEDNSMGITLVKTEAEVPAAMEDALKFDSEVLCEQYVALGREFRVGVLTRDDGALQMLPVIEYHLPTEKPIRTSA